MVRRQSGWAVVAAVLLLASVGGLLTVQHAHAQEGQPGYQVRSTEVILTVADIEGTADWYKRVLGWEASLESFDEEERCTFGSVYRPRPEDADDGNAPFPGFYLSAEDVDRSSYSKEAKPATIFIRVDNVDAVYDLAVAGGAQGVDAPEDQPWGMRSLSLTDPNGFTLMFGQEI